MPKTLADVTVVTYIRYIDTRKREIRSQRKECGWCGLKHVTSCFRWTHFWKLWTKPDRFWAGASRCMTTSLTEETTVGPSGRTTETQILTDAIGLVCGTCPRHLTGLHDDLHSEALCLLPKHRHDHAHLQVPLDHDLPVLSHLALLPQTSHLCSWHRVGESRSVTFE